MPFLKKLLEIFYSHKGNSILRIKKKAALYPWVLIILLTFAKKLHLKGYDCIHT